MICKYCNTTFVNKYNLATHIKSNKKCLSLRGETITMKTLPLTEYNDIQKHISNIEKSNEQYDDIIKQLVAQLEQKDRIIDKLNRKKSRQQFPEQNVIYILTTPYLKQNRTYIIGKATNLTTRLSTYNKSEEHEVIYYKQCKDEHLLSTTENVVLDKLNKYKINGNRDRITLPVNINIDVIINTINECIDFIN
ncbi:MAG: GIY-YIG nuclease family protein [Promethearchaeota archaeon]|jgi:hypothetical protein